VTDCASAGRPSRRRALALTMVGLFALIAGRPALAAEAGIVTALRGAATATRDGVSHALHVGAAVHQQDSVVTARGARLRITLADGSTLTLGEESQLVLASVAVAAEAGGGSMVFELLSGIVRAVIGPTPPAMFEVRGRAAVAAARSTEFIVETETRTTSVFVAGGEVVVRPTYGGGEAVLSTGDGIDVDRSRPHARSLRLGPGAPEDAALGPVRQWGPGRVAQVMARTVVED
jgi:hypothetical protein